MAGLWRRGPTASCWSAGGCTPGSTSDSSAILKGDRCSRLPQSCQIPTRRRPTIGDDGRLGPLYPALPATVPGYRPHETELPSGVWARQKDLGPTKIDPHESFTWGSMLSKLA